MGNKEGFPTPQLRLTVPTSSLLPECSAPSAYMKGINATHSSTRDMHSTVSAFASSSGSILRLRLRYVFEPLHCMPFIASFKNGVRTSTDPYGKDSHLGFFVNVQVGPQTAPAIPHGLPTSLSSLHHTHLLFSTVCAITHSTQTALRPRHPCHRRVLHHHLHHHPRDRARLDYRPGQRECCSVFTQRSKNTTSQVLRSSAVRHALSLSSAGPASLH